MTEKQKNEMKNVEALNIRVRKLKYGEVKNVCGSEASFSKQPPLRFFCCFMPKENLLHSMKFSRFSFESYNTPPELCTALPAAEKRANQSSSSKATFCQSFGDPSTI